VSSTLFGSSHHWRHSAHGALQVTLVLGCLVLAACGGTPEQDVQSTPEQIYARAHKSLVAQNYENAIRVYEALEARYPFSDSARQGRLDLMYAYYKNGETESAVDAADTFIRENPTHPRVDYAHYIKGLVYFEAAPNIVERLFNVDQSQRPPSEARNSFAAFQAVVQQHPRSEYAHDARRRMIYLRNRLADYETGVARYYLKRGAYVGALARAKYTIEAYDGAPAVREALLIMVDSYRALDMPDLAQQAERVYAQNFPEDPDALREKRRWWWPFG
jgi:outer membrane protein assembly factor BamD